MARPQEAAVLKCCCSDHKTAKGCEFYNAGTGTTTLCSLAGYK